MNFIELVAHVFEPSLNVITDCAAATVSLAVIFYLSNPTATIHATNATHITVTATTASSTSSPCTEIGIYTALIYSAHTVRCIKVIPSSLHRFS